MNDDPKPEDVQPPFFRFAYRASSRIFTITAHDKPSANQEGALFGVTIGRGELIGMVLHWLAHAELHRDMFGSLKAHTAVVKIGDAPDV